MKVSLKLPLLSLAFGTLKFGFMKIMKIKQSFLRFLQEPLIQFLFLGAIIFIVDSAVSLNRTDPNNIIVDDDKLYELIGIFEEGQGRKPSAKEVDNLIVKWSQNEILYREARKLGLDNGDDMIRNRLILKIRNILFNNVINEAPKEEELQAWFNINREKYRKSDLYDFEQIPVENREQAESLSHSQSVGVMQDDILRYAKRPAKNVYTLFGRQDGQKLLDAKLNYWCAVESSSGWHIARITRYHPARDAEFKEVRNRVINDWKKVSNDMQLAEQTKAIADQYNVVIDFSKETSDMIDSLVSTNKSVKTSIHESRASR